MREVICEKSRREHKASARFEDVMYFRADCKYVEAHHPGGVVLLDDALVALEREYGDRLLRIHRSILVAIDKPMRTIRADGRYFLKIEGVGPALPIARRYQSKIVRMLA